MSKEKTKALIVSEYCFRCCQSNILLEGSLLKLVITNRRGCLKVKYEMTFVQKVLCEDGQIELVFLFGFLEKPEKLDFKIIEKNLKNCGWDKYSILLAKIGVKKFQELVEKPGKVIIVRQQLLLPAPPA